MVPVEPMAYLRKEEEKVEMDYPAGRVWTAIQEVLTSLDWSIEEINQSARHVKVKTKSSFMSFGSVLLIDVTPVKENSTRVSVVAETPVTTITSIADFGQSKRRINQLWTELARKLAT